MAVVEISVDSAESALAAQQGGAHRVELCSSLREGGLTPSLGLVREVRSLCSLPVLVIVRPRGGDFLYSESEFQVMQEDIRILRQERVAGIVLGVLTAKGEVDMRRTRELVALAAPMEVTFHRAFDMTSDLGRALEDAIDSGAHRLLTSGGESSATKGTGRLRKLVEQAAGRISIVVGGGVRPENIGALLQQTGATEFHSSMRRVVTGPMLHQARHMSLGEPGFDEFTRTVVLAEDVRQLVGATEAY